VDDLHFTIFDPIQMEDVLIVRVLRVFDGSTSDAATYTAQIAMRDPDRGDHTYQRLISGIDTHTTNALGLLKAAMDALPEEAFRFEHPTPRASDVARGFPPAL